MSETISFIKDTIVEKTTTLATVSLDTAILKYGKSTNLPESESANVLIFTNDTGELFMGQGTGKELASLDKVLFFEKSELFPAPGEPNYLYVDKANKGVYIWMENHYEKLTGGEGGVTPVVVKWTDIQNKPASFVPASHEHTSYALAANVDAALANHNHDVDYYGKAYIP